MRLARLLAALFGTATLAGPALALDCREQSHAGNAYVVCEVDPAADDLRLFLYDDEGAPLGHFDAIDAALRDEGKALAFAMNAGMYHEDRAPVGHYVEEGREVMRVIPNPGPGNFGMLPNGVFCFGDGRARVIETLRFREEAEGTCRFATQSGPMLVIDGELHPRFLPDSTWRYLRNGVGTTDNGDRAVFVISRNAVTFHEFGSFFRDALGLNQALYFDGNVSRLHAPALGRTDGGRQMGPVVGVAVPAE
ncbi:MAG: phosphodiester glycosidase family protein [Pseudooceanicola nanhaiensis]